MSAPIGGRVPTQMWFHEQFEPRRGDDKIRLPPGFRFHPTDEELVGKYLLPKIFRRSFPYYVIGEVDFNKCEPWELPAKAQLLGDLRATYFFGLKDRKYPTGMRTNRATLAGYWKATGKDREVIGSGDTKMVLGMKKTLVFYKGRAPKGEKTNWIMHEYRLEGGELQRPPGHDEWVVCRVFEKSVSSKKTPEPQSYCDPGYTAEYSFADQSSSSLPALQSLGSSNTPTYSNSDFQPKRDSQLVLPFPEQVAKIRRLSNSSLTMSRQPQFMNGLGNLVPGFDGDGGTPVWGGSPVWVPPTQFS